MRVWRRRPSKKAQTHSRRCTRVRPRVLIDWELARLRVHVVGSVGRRRYLHLTQVSAGREAVVEGRFVLVAPG